MRVQIVDPSAFTPPYDHALASALSDAGAAVQLITSPFAYGEVPAPDGYVRRELFYRRAVGAPGGRLRRASKLAGHVPGMLRLRHAAAAADIVHFQWLTAPVVDVHLLPDRPLVLTAHDLLPREPRRGQVQAQRRVFDRADAIVVHSRYGRSQLVDELGVPGDKVHVIHHGAFTHVAAAPRAPLPPELGAGAAAGVPVVLFVGLLRPYKGLDVLLRAWREVPAGGEVPGGAELWIAGRPMMALEPLHELATPSVRFVPRFVGDGEIAALLARADVVVLPYARTERFDFSGVLASALAFGKPVVLSDVGGFAEVAAAGAARLVPAGDVAALAGALSELLLDGGARERLAAAARAAAEGPYSWREAAGQTLALYERVRRPR